MGYALLAKFRSEVGKGIGCGDRQMIADYGYQPWRNLTGGHAHLQCKASVIVPARNEADSLAAMLDGLSSQVDIDGQPLSPHTFEVLLLLNNCTDGSKRIATEWKATHPHVDLQVLECRLDGDQAHVGTARRLLMDTAWSRFKGGRNDICAILSTDADSLVASDWVIRNLTALEIGADAVGGMIQLKAGELDALPAGARRAYLLDRVYQRLVAELEDMLDPQVGDRWPRHREHFGASLACTTEAYARSGGMPPVKPLEDVAFVEALRRSGCVVRHDPQVLVYTSARFDGRAEIGLSYQLREWQRLSESHEPHLVDSEAWLTHRFSVLANLRELYRTRLFSAKPFYSAEFADRIKGTLAEARAESEFLAQVNCDEIVQKTFEGKRVSEIRDVNCDLATRIESLRLTFPRLPY